MKRNESITMRGEANIVLTSNVHEIHESKQDLDNDEDIQLQMLHQIMELVKPKLVKLNKTYYDIFFNIFKRSTA